MFGVDYIHLFGFEMDNLLLYSSFRWFITFKQQINE